MILISNRSTKNRHQININSKRKSLMVKESMRRMKGSYEFFAVNKQSNAIVANVCGRVWSLPECRESNGDPPYCLATTISIDSSEDCLNLCVKCQPKIREASSQPVLNNIAWRWHTVTFYLRRYGLNFK